MPYFQFALGDTPVIYKRCASYWMPSNEDLNPSWQSYVRSGNKFLICWAGEGTRASLTRFWAVRNKHPIKDHCHFEHPEIKYPKCFWCLALLELSGTEGFYHDFFPQAGKVCLSPTLHINSSAKEISWATPPKPIAPGKQRPNQLSPLPCLQGAVTVLFL